ncbi:hypothetical protein SORBI_3008G033750 [Sorghum bicolor]|uniref:Uncharacterized protein n=1 Tax=Sorghum bicolor TaxID=4558 RepID=A0A1Z5R5H2_SORBI|nr:hypothetical protein SORBI_3008G033750 [Sorghum bicolor]
MRRRSQGFIGCLKRKIRQQIPAKMGLARSVALSRCPARLCEGEESRGSLPGGPRCQREKREGGASVCWLSGPIARARAGRKRGRTGSAQMRRGREGKGELGSGAAAALLGWPLGRGR